MSMKPLTNPACRLLGRGMGPAAALMLVLAGCGSGSSSSPSAGTSVKATATPASGVANCLGKDTPLNQAPKATADLWRHVNEMADESKALVAACSDLVAPVAPQVHNFSGITAAAAQQLVAEFERSVTWQNWAGKYAQPTLYSHLADGTVFGKSVAAAQNGDQTVSSTCHYPANVALVSVPSATTSALTGNRINVASTGVAYAYVGPCDTTVLHANGTTSHVTLAGGVEFRALEILAPTQDPVLGDIGIVEGQGDSSVGGQVSQIISDSGV